MYWTLEDAVELVRNLEVIITPAGFGIAITGSVLIKGLSEHDLDLVFYPLNTSTTSYDYLVSALQSIRWKRVVSRFGVMREWSRKGSTDCKHVEVWETSDGKRVDIFYLH